MRGRVLLSGVLAVAAIGAGDAPASVTVDDPCGDMAAVSIAGGDTVTLQPDDWDRNDVAGLTVVEVRDGDDVVGVDLLVEMCGDVAVPDRPGERVEVRWPVTDDCWASTLVSQGPDPVYVVGNIGAPTTLEPTSRISVRCYEEHAWVVATVHEEVGVELAPERIARDGRTLSLSLRADELGELAELVASGVTIDGANAVSYAATGVATAHSWEVHGHLGTGDWTAGAPPLTLGE